MKKRIVSLALVLAMVLGAMPFTAAEVYGQENGDFITYVEDGSFRITISPAPLEFREVFDEDFGLAVSFAVIAAGTSVTVRNVTGARVDLTLGDFYEETLIEWLMDFDHGPNTASHTFNELGRFELIFQGWQYFWTAIEFTVVEGTYKPPIPKPAPAPQMPERVITTPMVSAMWASQAFLQSDGTVWTRGFNNTGQLGHSEVRNTHFGLRQVPGLYNVTAVAMGNFFGTTGGHTVALLSDGTVWQWGDIWAVYDRSGAEAGYCPTTPFQIPGVTDITAIAASGFNALALRQDGSLWAWGGSRLTQVEISDVTAIDANHSFYLALRSDGTVWAWGTNEFGQLGIGTTWGRAWGTPRSTNTPHQVHYLRDVTAIAAGYSHALALRADGTVWAWGSNGAGQLGDGTFTERHTPVQVQGLPPDIVVIGADSGFSYAISSDGTAWLWGRDWFSDVRELPSPIPFEDVVAVAGAGGSSFIVVSGNGDVWFYDASQTPRNRSALLDINLAGITLPDRPDRTAAAITDPPGRAPIILFNGTGLAGVESRLEGILNVSVTEWETIEISFGRTHEVPAAFDLFGATIRSSFDIYNQGLISWEVCSPDYVTFGLPNIWGGVFDGQFGMFIPVTASRAGEFIVTAAIYNGPSAEAVFTVEDRGFRPRPELPGFVFYTPEQLRDIDFMPFVRTLAAFVDRHDSGWRGILHRAAIGADNTNIISMFFDGLRGEFGLTYLHRESVTRLVNRRIEFAREADHPYMGGALHTVDILLFGHDILDMLDVSGSIPASSTLVRFIARAYGDFELAISRNSRENIQRLLYLHTLHDALANSMLSVEPSLIEAVEDLIHIFGYEVQTEFLANLNDPILSGFLGDVLVTGLQTAVNKLLLANPVTAGVTLGLSLIDLLVASTGIPDHVDNLADLLTIMIRINPMIEAFTQYRVMFMAGEFADGHYNEADIDEAARLFNLIRSDLIRAYTLMIEMTSNRAMLDELQAELERLMEIS